MPCPVCISKSLLRPKSSGYFSHQFVPVKLTWVFLVYSMEEAKKNMYAFSTTTYTGFQCTVSEETSEKFKGEYIIKALEIG